MLRPMPSPRGTNHKKRFIIDRSRAGAAYDAAPKLSDEAALDLLEFLRGKLSEEDLAEFCHRAGIDQGVTMDEPEPFKGMPRPTTTEQAQDQARVRMIARAAAVPPATRRSLEERFPHAAKIKVS